MKTLLLVAWALSSGAAPAPTKDCKEPCVVVTAEKGDVMAKPQYFGKPLGKVRNTDRLPLLDRTRYPWLKVLWNGKEAWLHSSAVADATKLTLTGAGKGAEEGPVKPDHNVNLAARGFDALTEEKYAANKADVQKALVEINKHEERDARAPDPAEMRAFVETGHLTTGGAP